MKSPDRVACFGEILLRLSSPARQLLLQTPHLETCVGGAEANVAVALAAFGRPSAVISALPDNHLGQAAAAELRRRNVDVAGVRFVPGRLGLYFLTHGAGARPSEVLYDRTGSAFALASPESFAFEECFAGVSWLHLSGITPAVSASATQAALLAARCASEAGLPMSFDCNYRPALWGERAGEAPGIHRTLCAQARVLFAEARDIEMILGTKFPSSDPSRRLREAASAAFGEFEGLQHIAATQRSAASADRQELSAVLFSRDSSHATAPRLLSGIVDRIGSGDAFAAGILHRLMADAPIDAAAGFGLAAACLKHTIPGDFLLASEAEVERVLAGDRVDVRR